MESIIKRVRDKLIFTFSDGSTYTLQNSIDSTQSVDNYITSVKVKESICNTGSNIIGSLGSSQLTLNIKSKDKLLCSNNSSSAYYGMMNETCKIHLYVYCTELESTDDNYEIDMGVYYVDSWEEGASYDSSQDVTITCSNIMNRIKNIVVNKILIDNDSSFSDFLVYVITHINSDNNYNISYDRSTFDVIEGSIVDWKIHYKNMSSFKFVDIGNDIINNTLAFIFADRSGVIKCDSLIDDNFNLSIGNLTGSTNLFSYNSIQGNLSNYSGFKIKYVDGVNIIPKNLGTYDNYQPINGTNKISISSSDKIVAIDMIDVSLGSNYNNADSTNIDINYNIKDIVYHESGVDIYFTTNQLYPLKLTVYGRVKELNYNEITRYTRTEKNEVLEITNKILNTSGITEYADKLKEFILLQNNMIQAEGYINPYFKPGDIVYVQGVSLNIDGYYKIISTEMTLNTNFRNKLTLLRTYENNLSADEIMYHNMEVLESNLNGIEVDTSAVVTLTSSYENKVLDIYESNFEDLEEVLDGV